MAAYEVLLLNTAVPQIQAAQSGDTYVVPRDIAFSTVASFAAGTALLPSIARAGDLNTGFWFPAADTIAASTGGTEQMRLDASGNLGLGVTPSAQDSTYKSLQIGGGAFLFNNVFGPSSCFLYANAYQNSSNVTTYYGNAAASGYLQNAGSHIWYTAPSGTAGNAITFTQAMTLDASGNLVVGGTSANVGVWNKAITLNTATGNLAYELTVAGAAKGFLAADASNVYLQSSGAIPLIFTTNGTERARITSGGDLLVGTTSAIASAKFNVVGDVADLLVRLRNSNASPGGLDIEYSGAAPNGAGNFFFLARDTGGNRFYVQSNGGIANYQGNDSNLSDRREKTNFAPAGDYLSKICAIPVQTFNYIDQNLEDDPGLTLGVVAQDVQAVAPELVMESNWGTKDEPKMRLSIYQTDLQYALMKCIQEQQAMINELKAEVAALKGN